MSKLIRFGIIGLGGRGRNNAGDVILSLPDTDITAVCDLYPDRMDMMAEVVKEKRGHDVFRSADYKDILKREDVDAVYIATSWESHVEIATAAIKAGMPSGVEVGGAYNVDELWRLVRAWEEYKTPFMFMENCCFNEQELLATSMHRDGKFGRVVHCSGAYSHDLREEITKGNIKRHYRLRNYTNRNSENYPTHELGPIAKLLNINRGNRITSLVSVASCAAGLEQYVKDHPELVEQDPTLKDRRFNQGDIVNTILTCAGGETILLKLDTTLPRSYSREFNVRGTKGAYFMDTNTVFMDGDKEYWQPTAVSEHYLNSADAYREEYMPDCWLNITEEERKFGHGGMDAIMFKEFMDCLREGRDMPIDVYDAAAWMAITALSEQSILAGGAPVAVPDFTDGKWMIRPQKDVIPLGKKN